MPLELPRRIDGLLTVIGDVHGQRAALEALLGQLAGRPDFQDRWLVFVGDLVDRGPDSKGVVQTIVDLRARRAKVTGCMGNHDLALLGALGLFEYPPENNWDYRYAGFYSCRPTCVSYVPEWADEDPDWPGWLAHAPDALARFRQERRALFDRLRQAVPAEHQELLLALPWCIEHPDYVVVHAGLLPDRPYEEQLAELDARDLSADTPPWLCDRDLVDDPRPRDCKRTVVCGHVPVSVGSVFSVWGKVLADTGAGYPSFGMLSAVLLPERQVISVPVA